MWWHTPVTPALGRLGQKDHEFQPGLHSEKKEEEEGEGDEEGEWREGEGEHQPRVVMT